MATSREFGSIRHLAGRFFDALVPIGPPDTDERWAEGHLLPGEQALWRRMSGPDRRHAVGVARRTIDDLAIGDLTIDDLAIGDLAIDDLADPEERADGVARGVVAAALLHDVGKVEAGLGTWARAGVTFAGMAYGRERLVGWSGVGDPEADGPPTPPVGGRSWRRRIGLYLCHDRVGAGLLSSAGSDLLTVAWAGEHHRPPERWTVSARIGAALKLADDD